MKNHITINWHITEQCNYKCYYCFAHYDKDERINEPIYQENKKIDLVLDKLYKFFSKNFKEVRLNIAGGEPTLVKNLGYLIKKAYKIGFKVSIITNSSKLNKEFIKENAKFLYLYGTSIDSIDEKTIRKIGRCNREVLDIEELKDNIRYLKIENPNIKIKINTVVNEFNYNEYLGDFINDLESIDKWKVLKAFPFKNKIYCNEYQFNYFLANHSKFKRKIFKENNNDMQDSYIMIDPFGRFYQNSNNFYHYTNSILDTNIEIAFKQINFNIEKFYKRYELK